MVTLISSIHQAVETKVKTNFMGQPFIKPFLVHDYNIRIGGVDLSNNFLSHYQTLKSIKWYRKLLLTSPHKHGNSKCTFTNKKYGNQKMSHTEYREYIAIYLITTSVKTATCLKRKPLIEIDNTQLRLAGKYFIRKFPPVPSSIRKSPVRKCSECNFTHQQLAKMGQNDLSLQIKNSSYGCTICSHVTLCLMPCFEIFHSKLNYRQEALEYRILEIL